MNWSRGCSIGHGSSATVSLATVYGSGEVLAVKSAELQKSEFLQREQAILSSLKSPYIVDYKGCDVTMENGRLMYNIFMEYIPGGTLAQAGSLDECTIRSYMRTVLQGLDYLHLNGVVHCDIKGSNILVGIDGAKIADLGCARQAVESSSRPLQIAGTPMFMAPEVVRGEEQGFSADIWAVGCTMIEMATGRPPWPDVKDPISAVYRIALTDDTPALPKFFSDHAKDFLSKCLKRDPQERWTAHELLKHPFLDESSANSKFFEVSSFTSPTSILDQGFWDSLEEPQTPQSSYSASAAERLQQLVKTPGLPNWTWDEGWVTVRDNIKCETVCLQNEKSMHMIAKEEALTTTSRSQRVTLNPELEMKPCQSSVLGRSLLKNYNVVDFRISRQDFVQVVSNIEFEKQYSVSYISKFYENIYLFNSLNFLLSHDYSSLVKLLFYFGSIFFQGSIFIRIRGKCLHKDGGQACNKLRRESFLNNKTYSPKN